MNGVYTIESIEWVETADPVEIKSVGLESIERPYMGSIEPLGSMRSKGPAFDNDSRDNRTDKVHVVSRI